MRTAWRPLSYIDTNRVRFDSLNDMPPPVKRQYDNDGRRARSHETRRRLLQVSRELFIANGYRATTVAEIARRAGTHVDTLYTLVGRKPQILHELIELAISGTDQPVPPEERDYVE